MEFVYLLTLSKRDDIIVFIDVGLAVTLKWRDHRDWTSGSEKKNLSETTIFKKNVQIHIH